MAEPPKAADLGEDFRSLPEGRSLEHEPWLAALLRDIRARQEAVRAVLESEDEAVHRDFIGSASMDDGVPRVVAHMRERLGLTIEEYRAAPTVEAAFAHLRGAAERLGVFVLLIGNLGSHHTALPVAAFRGFALADPIAPFVVINDQDAKVAWSFTLLHELAHLWLGKTGVSGGSFAASRLEQFCNDVASQYLLPDTELRQFADLGRDTAAALRAIGHFAAGRKVSRPLVAYRLFREGVIDRDFWQGVDDTLREEREREAARERPDGDEGGPSYYVVRRHRLGPALIDFVRRNLDEGALTPTRASRILAVRPRSVEPLVRPTAPTRDAA
ncbi:MAG: ImmA/IrrE family metallo-endopeptidase [Acetobacteraceae bacterium]|nr:ImmA/IrrE family metallo-endopeptidase [Acetobacteraceae bacterium]